MKFERSTKYPALPNIDTTLFSLDDLRGTNTSENPITQIILSSCDHKPSRQELLLRLEQIGGFGHPVFSLNLAIRFFFLTLYSFKNPHKKGRIYGRLTFNNDQFHTNPFPHKWGRSLKLDLSRALDRSLLESWIPGNSNPTHSATRQTLFDTSPLNLDAETNLSVNDYLCF